MIRNKIIYTVNLHPLIESHFQQAYEIYIYVDDPLHKSLQATFCWNNYTKSFHTSFIDYKISTIPSGEYNWNTLSSLVENSVRTDLLYNILMTDESFANYDVKTLSYVHYFDTILYLEKNNIVTLRDSSYFLSSSTKQFMLQQKSIEKLKIDGCELPLIEVNLYDQWWEVDILGTQFDQNLGVIICELYKKINNFHLIKSLEYLWNWFGDREVFFCKEQDNIFTGSCDQMKECFEILHYTHNICFWRLKPDPMSLGLIDVMGNLYDSHLEMKENELCVFTTHDDDGEEIDVIEQWTTVPESWWSLNKDQPNIKDLICNLIQSK